MPKPQRAEHAGVPEPIDETALRQVISAAPDAMMLCDELGVIIHTNQLLDQIFGYQAGETSGRRIESLLPASMRTEHVDDRTTYMLDPIVRQMAPGGSPMGLRASGETFPVEVNLSPVEASDRTLVIASVRDITSRVERERQLTHEADHDPLTGLCNRRCFERELTRENTRAARYGGGAVLMLDLDNLKKVNDTYGHRAGDQLITTVAEMLGERLRDTDVLSRVGGDEFAILLPEVDRGEAALVAQQLLDRLHLERVQVDGGEVDATASIGLFTLGEENVTASEAMDRADRAMYEAKKGGRDRVVMLNPATPAPPGSVPSPAWADRIREAIDRDLLVPHYQPIMEISSNRVNRWELLTRMRSAEGQLIGPDNFLPAAEREGLIGEIDAWATRRAVAAIARSGAGADGPRIEVNLSTHSLTDQALIGVVEEEIVKSGIDPSRIIFEVDEAAAIANIEDTVRFADSIGTLGCEFALDGFGAGIGSFHYLRRLPLQYLKLDGRLIRNLPRSRMDQLVVRSVVDVAHGMGLSTIAAYVGDEPTVNLLREWEVGFCQGHHVGMPEAADPGTRGRG